MSKDIWHKADEIPEAFKTFVFKTDKGNICSDMVSTNNVWNPILLPEFYSMDDFDKAERITEWAYLDDLLALETELDRTRKALDVAKDRLDTVRQYHRGTAVIRPDDIAIYCDRAIEQITALEQKDVK